MNELQLILTPTQRLELKLKGVRSAKTTTAQDKADACRDLVTTYLDSSADVYRYGNDNYIYVGDLTSTPIDTITGVSIEENSDFVEIKDLNGEKSIRLRGSGYDFYELCEMYGKGLYVFTFDDEFNKLSSKVDKAKGQDKVRKAQGSLEAFCLAVGLSKVDLGKGYLVVLNSNTWRCIGVDSEIESVKVGDVSYTLYRYYRVTVDFCAKDFE